MTPEKSWLPAATESPAADASTPALTSAGAASPEALWQPRRAIQGLSAVLLPMATPDTIDWPAWEAHLARTAAAGLKPAINMDTGHVHSLDLATQDRLLERARAVLGNEMFYAGAYVPDGPGDSFNADAYARRMERIQASGAVPVVFPSYGLTQQAGPAMVEAHRRLARGTDRFVAFELSPVFAACGAIFDLETYAGLLEIPACVGAKHSSLSRNQEWQRLALRNARRSDFRVYTGNDLAIDMVMYGSDYLLGLSTMAPDLFACRDALWAAGDADFYTLNDWLQYLGMFTFRPPVPAYRHSAAQFLCIRGWLADDATPPGCPRRPESDQAVLRSLWEALRPWTIGSPA